MSIKPQLIAFIACMSIFSCKSQNQVTNPDYKIESIVKKISTYTDKDDFHGAILIAHGGKIKYQSAFGKNNHDVKNEINSSFDLASMGKMFTGLAIAQLESAGKLGYDDKIITYLTNYKGNTSTKKITLEHLLTHTSGIPDIFSYDFIQKILKQKSITVEEYFAHFHKNPYSTNFLENLPLEFEPGSTFSYSNSGYLLLGLIVEKISGLKYDEYVKQNILKPLQMNNTKLISSYGGGPSTIGDMFLLYKGLASNALIDEQKFNFISSGKIKIEKNKYYAHGFESDQRYNSKIVSHKGGGPESKAQFIMFPKTNYFVIIYSNNNHKGYKEFNKLRDYIRKVLS